MLHSSTREEARFLVINLWATAFPNFVWEKNKNMTEQIDSLIPHDFEYRYKPDLFLSSKLNTFSYIKEIYLTNTLNYKYSSIKLDTIQYIYKYIYEVFDSPPLRIDCEWINKDYKLKWEWANFTFKFNDSTSRTISVNMSFDGDDHNPFEPEIDISNGFV